MLSTSGNITARRFGRRLLSKQLKAILGKEFEVEKFSDAIVFSSDTSIAVCFNSGIVVNWGGSTIISSIAERSVEFFEDVYVNRYEQEYHYKVAHNTIKIAEDTLHLDASDTKAVVAASHAIARSVQLEYNEALVEAVFDRIADLPNRLKESGKISMSSTQIKRLIGLVVEAQYSLSTFGLADDRPEILWEQPEYEQAYRAVAEYLELHDRWSVLTEKISVLESTLSILRDEVNTKRSRLFEWIVIAFFGINALHVIYQIYMSQQ